MNLRSLTLLMVLLAQANTASAQRLGEVAKEFVKTLPAGFITTAESLDGKEVYAIAGKQEPAGTPPEKILYEIGSISKVFTGLLLAQAVVEKKLTLQTTVRELAGPGVTFSDANLGDITVKQLATHSSGLPMLPDNLAEDSERTDPYMLYDRAKLDAWIAKARLDPAVIGKEAYSNLGCGLLGDLLARLYGRSWAELVAEKITKPLGLNDTTVNLTPDQAARLAPPYTGSLPGHTWTFNALAGAGALRSTAADMVIFGKALLSPEGTPFAEAIKLLMQPHMASGGGLLIQKGKKGAERWWHNGGTGSYRSRFDIIPSEHSVRVVLINNSELEADGIMLTALGFSPPPTAPGKFEAYAGEYAIDPKIPVRLTVAEMRGGLALKLSGQQFLQLKPLPAADRFEVMGVKAEVQFHRKDGAIIGATQYQGSTINEWKRLK